MMTQIMQNKIIPRGWLRRQLEIQANGLAGHLDQVWPDVRDSAWVGGDREGWERMPYWLDGFIPLAYLLRDDALIKRADRYVKCILDRQNADGWICPVPVSNRSNYDVWALFLIGKVLAMYCQLTDDVRAHSGLYAAMKWLKTHLDDGTVVLKDWGKARWFEALIPLLYLYEQQPEPWIKELALTLRCQGTDYPSLVELWKEPTNTWRYTTHIVNLMMMLKYEALTSALLGETYTNEAEKLWNILENYNGTAVGTITGDECLSGIGNTHGTELCSVVELMYSFEWLYGCTGDSVWMDRLERVAFNALPATMTEDMWAHQYDQMVNQIACCDLKEKSIFRTNTGRAHLFGLEPHFGCCTANFGQGWPKLAMSTILRDGDDLLCAAMLPVEAQVTIKDVPVTVTVDTEYPFKDTCRFTVNTADAIDFKLRLRVPAWVTELWVNGKSVTVSDEIVLGERWKGTHTVDVRLKRVPVINERPNDLQTISYGPLVFSLPIKTEYCRLEYTDGGVERKFPYCDYELTPHSPWNFGFVGEEATVEEHPVTEIPYSASHPPLTLQMRMATVNWQTREGFDTVSAERPVSDEQTSPAQECELIPYGCAKLRMTEMPRVK